MAGIILAGLFVVVLVAAIGYLIVRQGSAPEVGRQVEVRVRSCEQKGEAENRLYYEMQVELYGANGEVLVRTMQSAKKYVPGSVIRCRYMDRTDLLVEEMAPEVQKKSKNNLLLFLVIVLIFVGIAGTAIWYLMSGKELPAGSNRIVGYLIGILFMAVGVFGICQKGQMKQKMQGMISLPGMQVDYTITEHPNSEGSLMVRTYNPVYEYEWGGERRRIASPVGGSGRKYRFIGRKVQILVDPHTGKAICKEDTIAGGNWYIGFGIIGLIVFLLMLLLSFGVLS